MTLGDLLRKYFEERRRICEHKVRCLDSNKNIHFSSNQDDDKENFDGYSDVHISNHLNSNDKNNRLVLVSSPRISKRMSQTSRIVQLPDGTIQVETTIRDDKGNEEKSVTYQKDGKKFTKTIRRDPSGTETVEENVANADSNDTIVYNFEDKIPTQYFNFRNSLDSGYDYWFNKFFKPGESHKNETIPFDSSSDMEEQINRILKRFEGGNFFDSFLENKKNSPSKGQEDFPKMTDFTLSEEARKFIENFEKDNTTKQKNMGKNRNGNNERKIKRRLEKAMKSFSQPKSSSMFEQFAERALLELPEEKTPFDKFIEPDEEKQQKIKALRRETEQLVKRIDQNFSETNALNSDDVYSDIEQSKNDGDELTLMTPRQENINPNMADIVDTFRKAFGPNAFSYATINSEMNLGNGRKRIESIKKDAKGNAEKTVTYKIGKKSFRVVTVTDQFGNEVRKERNLNFSEDELSDFKSKWDNKFHTDFND